MEKRVECARKYLELVRKKFQESSSKYEEFLKIMKSFKEQKLDTENVCKQVQELFKGHKNLLMEFNKLIPANYRLNIETRPHYSEAVDYMRRVKEETKENPGIYNEFITVLKKYQERTMSIEEVNLNIRSIMSDYPALIENFKAFLPSYNEESSSAEAEESDQPPKQVKKKSPPHILIEKNLVEAITEPVIKIEQVFIKRLKKIMDLNSLPGTDFFLELGKCFELYAVSVITKTELAKMVEPLFKLTNFCNFLQASHHQTRRFPKDENKEVSAFIQAKLDEMFEVFKAISASREVTRRKHGWFFRPLNDFDTAKTKKFGHSYLKIQRPRILKDKKNEEINEILVSVPYGSEDLSFRNFRKNMFEDALFKCEDERYEFDLAIENACSTLRVLERALEDANSLSPGSQKSFQLDEKFFEKIRMRPILSIYSEHASKIIEMLKSNPIRSLPVVISRIKGKVETWKKTTKSDSEKIWKETIEKNYFKSLDHRSFYFKQHEKKMMNPKSFLVEARQRYLAREENKNLLRKYLRKEMTQQTFEFLGGSRNTLFFNSFSGLTGGMVHKISSGFNDDVIEEFKELDKGNTQIPYANAMEYAVLPHFRMLFSCENTVFDAVRLVVLAIDRSSLIEKGKVDSWLFMLIEDFLGFKVPSDVVKHKVEEFFEGLYFEESEFSDKKKMRKNLKEEGTENDSSGKLLQMKLSADANFKAFLPLLKQNKVMFCTQNLYFFIRFFYDIYERLLKVKYILSQGGKEYEYRKLEYGSYDFSEEVEREYRNLLKTLCLLLKNGIESTKFEDKCRSLLGNDSYVFFTFDKLINYAAKAIHSLSTDDLSNKSLSLIERFLHTRINEELYLANFFALSATTQVFRLHWSQSYGILSITYIESPYDKIGEQAVKNSQKYKKSFSSLQHSAWNLEEIESHKQRVSFYLKSNELDLNEYCKGVFQYNRVSYGIVENSYRFFFVPGGEDYVLNSRFYGNWIMIESESENYLCQDKNSLFQKMVELSEKKFKNLRDEWIMSFN